jgi:hypothetical protein
LFRVPLGQSNASTSRMREREKFAQRMRCAEVARHSAEYVIAIGIAMLCGYGIVLWRW